MVSLFLSLSQVLLLLNCLFQSQYVTFDINILQRNSSQFESLIKLSFESIDKLCIGTPYQCFKLYFDPSTIYSWVIESDVPNIPIENIFIHTSSSTYKLFYEARFTLPSNNILEGKQFRDRIKIGSFETNQTVLFLGSKIAKEYHYPVIGLQVGLDYSSSPSFLEQLVKHNEVNSLEYTFEYLSSARGRITFGNRDHSMKRFSFAIELETKYYLPYVVVLSHRIYLGRHEIDSSPSAITIDESFGFVQFPKRYRETIMAILFCNDSLINSCIQMKHSQLLNRGSITYSYYLCDNEYIQKNIKHMPELLFSFTTDSLVLYKEDLFSYFDDTKMILNIVFFDYTKFGQDIIIGHPILKHYSIIHQYTNNNKGRLLFYNWDSRIDNWIKKVYWITMSLNLLGIFLLILSNKNSFAYNSKRDNARLN